MEPVIQTRTERTPATATWLGRAVVLSIVVTLFLLFGYAGALALIHHPLRPGEDYQVLLVAAVSFAAGWIFKVSLFRTMGSKFPIALKISWACLFLAVAFGLFFGLDELARAWTGEINLTTSPLMVGLVSAQPWRLASRPRI